MQEGQNQPQDWQQPHTSSTGVPYVPDTEDDRGSSPVKDVDNDTPEFQETESYLEDSQRDESEDDVLLRWSADEYLHQERSAVWFGIAGLITVILVLIAIFLLKSITFAILIPVMALALFVYARRPPEAISYILGRKGLHVNDRLYPYSQFKSFGTLSHNQHHFVVLVPRKRFDFAQTVYFPEEIGEQLVDFLAARLPMKEVKPDVVDRIITKIRL